MLKTIAIALLASCADLSVDSGTVYKCSAVFICDGERFDVSPSTGCASDPDEALERYLLRLDVITKDARCTARSYEPSCSDTGAPCTISH